ncbi:MAG: 16S rRNA (uracil(1498)-N(3))-methyltransferase [Rhodospirillaceae bacterium TMED140]|nr:16S rRNA (uracil(1498)-N(3))-methyltransferase [Rhodospirillaceae bacterium]OUX71464.1 MAG: 16S rRNA (uracil(1498)-N(3))-methyltransferase [Rhodospirillaceae bacterium TMED140]
MTKPDRPTIRLFVEGELAAGQAFELAQAQAHYLRNVLRREVGSELGLFNGRGPEFRAVITTLGKKAAWVDLREPIADFEPERPLTLMFAPIKRTPMEWILAKGTELGVTRFQPVITEHTQSERLRPERLQTIMVEAAEQCERLTIPSLEQPLSLREAVRGFGGRIGAAFEAGGFSPVVQQLQPEPPSALLVGPEGGFHPDEVQWLADQDNVFGLSLGPRVLKAETAAIALIAVFQALVGDGDKHPDFRGSARH